VGAENESAFKLAKRLLLTPNIASESIVFVVCTVCLSVVYTIHSHINVFALLLKVSRVESCLLLLPSQEMNDQ